MSPEEAIKLAHKRGHGVVPGFCNGNQYMTKWNDPRWESDWSINPQRFLKALRECGYELAPCNREDSERGGGRATPLGELDDAPDQIS